MFYVEFENKIIFVDEDRDKLATTLIFANQYKDCVIKEVPDGYVAIVGKELMTQEEYQAEQDAQERARLDGLSMTRGDVFEAMILAKGLGKAQLRAMIEQAELDAVTKALYLNRFDEALEFYRGYPIFDMLGEALGITSEMLDKFFDTKDYHNLISCKLTINATPAEATVTVTPDIIPYGTTAHYKVECEGYVSKEGDIEMLKDETLDVVLEKESEQPAEPTEPEQPTDEDKELSDNKDAETDNLTEEVDESEKENNTEAEVGDNTDDTTETNNQENTDLTPDTGEETDNTETDTEESKQGEVKEQPEIAEDISQEETNE